MYYPCGLRGLRARGICKKIMFPYADFVSDNAFLDDPTMAMHPRRDLRVTILRLWRARGRWRHLPYI